MAKIQIKRGRLAWDDSDRTVSELIWTHDGKREVIGSVEEHDGYWWPWVPKKYWSGDMDGTEFYSKKDAKLFLEDRFGISVKVPKKKSGQGMHPFGL